MSRESTVLVSPPAGNRGIVLLKIAAIYLLAGLVMGIGMGMAHDYSLTSVHAHVLLLGWAALSVTGVVYVLLPGCATSKLAAWHIWSHNIGLPVVLISLTLFHYGSALAEKVLAGSSLVLLASLVFFTVNLFVNGSEKVAGAKAAQGR